MGRNSIEIKEIGDTKKRGVTFNKRRGGVFKKAMELSILTKANVLLVIIDENDKLFEYSSSNDPRPLLRQYFNVAHLEHERLCNDDYGNVFGTETLSSGKKKKKVKRPTPLRTNPSLLNMDSNMQVNNIDINKQLPLQPPQLPNSIINKPLTMQGIQERPRIPDLNISTGNIADEIRKSQHDGGVGLDRHLQIPPQIVFPPKHPSNRRRISLEHIPYRYERSTGFTPIPLKTPQSSGDDQILNPYSTQQTDILKQQSLKEDRLSHRIPQASYFNNNNEHSSQQQQQQQQHLQLLQPLQSHHHHHHHHQDVRINRKKNIKIDTSSHNNNRTRELYTSDIIEEEEDRRKENMEENPFHRDYSGMNQDDLLIATPSSPGSPISPTTPMTPITPIMRSKHGR